MASFTPPTYNQPVQNPLGKHGVSFPVGYIVYIDTNDDVYQATAIMGTFSEHRSPGGFAIASGSGDGGYAVFRRGITYEVSGDEGTLLTNAGYTVT